MTSDAQAIQPSDQIGFEDRYLILRKRGLIFTQENRKSFTLIPFELDGTVNDATAIEALKAYAIATTNALLRSDLLRWIGLADLHIFVWDNADEYVVATSPEEANELMLEHDRGQEDGRTSADWSQLDDDSEQAFDGVTKPAWQWCIEAGKGYHWSGNM